MATTVRAAFEEFAARLEPTERQRTDASAKHTGVSSCIAGGLYVHTWFLIGSYGRRTLIRPPQDIDLMIVLDSERHGNDYYYAYEGAQKALTKFHALLKDCYPDTPIRKDHPAVHLDFSTCGFDVVPAFGTTAGNYTIPSRFGAGWMETNPKRHAERTAEMNKATGSHFVPLVKMFKAWNASHYQKLTGFHLEMALANAWPRLRSATYPYSEVPVVYGSYAEGATALFPALSATLNYMTPDPAGVSGNIDDYLDLPGRTLTRQRLDATATDAQIAQRHEARGDHYLAITKWRGVFGDPFPAYS